MLAHLLRLSAVFLLSIPLALAQVEEEHVDFMLNPDFLLKGEIQFSQEWLEPYSYLQKEIHITDLPKISSSHPDSLQIIASKIAFITKQPFDELTYSRMNRSDYISMMFNSIRTRKISPGRWLITNRVKAYGLPFKVKFEFNFLEISKSSLPAEVVRYLRSETTGLSGTGRERFLVLDMTRFSQLMYRNYSLIYIKELNPNESLIISTVVTGMDINRANAYFNFPPFSRTENVMMRNLRTQILHMAHNIQHSLR